MDHTCTCNDSTTFEYKTHLPETQIVVSLLKFAWKTREITSNELILWRDLTICNHCESFSRTLRVSVKLAGNSKKKGFAVLQ